MDDSWTRFWDQLISDWVLVTVGAFLLQGLWFGLVSLGGETNPDSGGAISQISEMVFVPFWKGFPSVGSVLVGLGLAWGVKRALDAKAEVTGRR